MALTSDQRAVYSWGLNSQGQCGRQEQEEPDVAAGLNPGLVEVSQKVTLISRVQAGANFTLLVSDVGEDLASLPLSQQAFRGGLPSGPQSRMT